MPRTIPSPVPTLPLPHGPEIPQLGLGTWQLEGDECEAVVREALEMGYRHVDTAEMYENEKEVGRAVMASDVDRDDVFITSKVWRDNLRRNDLLRSLAASLERLGTDHLDLYLVHWPDSSVPMEETLGAMEEAREEGLVRAWGVSNFTVAHLEEALEHGHPSTNQVELHPRLRQPELDRFCREHDVVLTAYSPLAHGEAPDQPALDAIGDGYGKTGAQVALRWSVQRGHVVIPKSSGAEHLAENADIFDFTLTEDEMERIDALDRNERLIDPNFAEFERVRAGRR